MARHVWLINRFQTETVDNAAYIYRQARHAGLNLLGACCFVGYTIECCRQKGADAVEPVPILLATSARSGHRYARGKNGANYELAGRRLLACYLRDACWWPDRGDDRLLLTLIVAFGEEGHWQPLQDYLEERSGDPHYDGVREVFDGSRLLFTSDLVLARALASGPRR
jgi:hypothetical protein